MAGYKTEQEAFWAGEFGQDYIGRNEGADLLARKTAFYGWALRAASGVRSVCELGCNIGLNLRAIKALQPEFDLAGVEINETAAGIAAESGVATIHRASIIEDITHLGQFDLTFTMGVLIHLNPDHLSAAYRNLSEMSRRYVLVGEYYNPAPVAIPYRGHSDRLFKRDFAGDLMDQCGLRLVDYGFVYRRDNQAPLDDITWFLLEKQ